MKIFIIILIGLLNIPLHSQSSNLAEKLAEYNQQLVNKISIGSSPDEVKKLLGKPYAVDGGFPESDQTIFYGEFNSDQVGQLNYSTWFYKLSKKKISYTVYADTSYFINGVKVFFSSYNYYLDKDSIYWQPIWFINGEIVSRDLYNSYLNSDSVYLNIFKEIDFAPVIEDGREENATEKKSLDATGKTYSLTKPKAKTKADGGGYAKKESQEMKLDKMILSQSDIISYMNDYVLVKKESQETKVNKQHTETDTFQPILCVIFEKGTNVVALTKVYFQWL